MRCSACGQLIPEQATFCPHCGGSPSTSRRCLRCSAGGHTEGARFCFNCGGALDAAPLTMGPVTPLGTAAPLVEKRDTGLDRSTNVQNVINVLGTDGAPARAKGDHCALCGRFTLLENSFKCRGCGRLVCGDDYDSTHRLCGECAAPLIEAEERARRQAEEAA